MNKTEIKITPLFNFDAQKVIYVGIGSTVEDDADNAITLTSSIFRTGSFVNPTLTIIQLSLRLAEYLSLNFKS